MSTTNQQKFLNQTPIQLKLVGQFHKKFMKVLSGLSPETILELGCGEGYLLSKIHEQMPGVSKLGLDNLPQALEEGHRLFPDLKLEIGDIYHIAHADKSWDVVIASEVLEHLDEPLKALEELRRVAQRYVILTVPHEPWFRLGNLARGRNIKRFGNHPEHLNLWSRKSFVRFVSQRMTVQMVKGAFPWTIVVAKV